MSKLYFLYPRFYQKNENWLFFNQGHNNAHFLKNISNLNQKTIFSTSAKIGISCDIKLQISTFIFHFVLLHFFDFFYNDLIPFIFISRSQKKNILNFAYYCKSYGHLKINSLHNKKLNFNNSVSTNFCWLLKFEES